MSSTKQRTSRRTLKLALAGCWVVSLAGAGIYLAAEVAGDDRVGVLLFVVFPLALASLWPYLTDVWRNPRIGTFAAAVWGYAILYLPFAGATAYWIRHAPATDDDLSIIRVPSRVSRPTQDKAFGVFMVFAVVIACAWVGYILLVIGGVIQD